MHSIPSLCVKIHEKKRDTKKPSIRSNNTSDKNIICDFVTFCLNRRLIPNHLNLESAIISQRYYFFCILSRNNDFIFQLCLCGAVWQWQFVWYLKNIEDKQSSVCHQPTNNSEREKNTRDSKKSTTTRRQK